MNPPDQANAGAPSGSRGGHAFNLALALLVAVSVLVSAGLSHRLVAIHTRSLAIGRDIAELRQLAHQLDEPGNDVFSSRDVERERTRLASTTPLFDAALTRLGSQRYVGAADVTATRDAMHTLVRRAATVFERVGAGDMERAAAVMAAMDRDNAALTTTLATLEDHMRARELTEARRYQKIEWIVGVLVLLLAGNAIAQSRRMARRVLAAEEATERRARELEDARLEALEAARAKSDFLANMSHEIRTPLNAVIGMTSLLSGSALDAEQRDSVETIRTSGEHLLSVINDILDFSKIEAGKLELEQTPVELRTCFEESVDLISHQAAEKGLELAAVVDPSCPETIWGDAGRLRQVLVNLLGNAVKFTASGSVILRARAEQHAPGEHALHLAVEDTGVGIPADRLDRLFQSFTQVDASTTRRFGGTGLGLAIVRRLVEHMCGRVWVESEVGVGSTFPRALARRRSGERSSGNAPCHSRGALRPTGAGRRRPRRQSPDPREPSRGLGHGRGTGGERGGSAGALREGRASTWSSPTIRRMPERDGLDLALAIAGLALPTPPRIVLSRARALTRNPRSPDAASRSTATSPSPSGRARSSTCSCGCWTTPGCRPARTRPSHPSTCCSASGTRCGSCWPRTTR
ncbi:MAG: ATP-binding protein [bacterium]